MVSALESLQLNQYSYCEFSREKYREMNKELHMVFVDLEKAHDRVPRELIGWCLRKKGVRKGYATIIQYMYNDCETPVSTRTRDTEYFQV